MQINVLVNGERRALAPPTTIERLLAELGLQQARVAVAVNREVIPRSLHAQHELRDDDRIEIVRAIGGGR